MDFQVLKRDGDVGLKARFVRQSFAASSRLITAAVCFL